MSGKEAVDSTPVASARDTLVPWVEKYRPASLSDITAHEHIIGTGAFSQSLASSIVRRHAHTPTPTSSVECPQCNALLRRIAFRTCCSTVRLALARPRLS